MNGAVVYKYTTHVPAYVKFYPRRARLNFWLLYLEVNIGRAYPIFTYVIYTQASSGTDLNFKPPSY